MTTPRDILKANRLLSETEEIGAIRYWTTGAVQKMPDGSWKPLPHPKNSKHYQSYPSPKWGKCAISGEKFRPGDTVCQLPSGKVAIKAYAKAAHQAEPMKLPPPAPELEIFSATGYAKCALSGEKIRPGDAVCKLKTGKLAHLAYAKAPHTVKTPKPHTTAVINPNDPFEGPYDEG